MKTVLALCDYSNAFDRVWREDLLTDKGLPIAYAQWLHDVLSNRKANVQINGDRGRQPPLRLGTNILIGLNTCWASHVWPHNTMDLPENIINDNLQFAFVV